MLSIFLRAEEFSALRAELSNHKAVKKSDEKKGFWELQIHRQDSTLRKRHIPHRDTACGLCVGVQWWHVFILSDLASPLIAVSADWLFVVLVTKMSPCSLHETNSGSSHWCYPVICKGWLNRWIASNRQQYAEDSPSLTFSEATSTAGEQTSLLSLSFIISLFYFMFSTVRFCL